MSEFKEKNPLQGKKLKNKEVTVKKKVKKKTNIVVMLSGWLVCLAFSYVLTFSM